MYPTPTPHFHRAAAAASYFWKSSEQEMWEDSQAASETVFGFIFVAFEWELSLAYTGFI